MENKHGLQTIVFTVFLLLARWIVFETRTPSIT